MDKLADVVLDYYWFLNFCSDDEMDFDASVRKSGELAYSIVNEFSESEKEALREAAKRSLASWLREPDEHGYTPRTLITSDQRAFLQAIADGHFTGPPLGEDEG